MRVHWLQHVPFEGLGAIAPWLAARDAGVTATRLFEDPALPGVDAFDWLVIVGGPMSVHDEARLPWLAAEKRLIAEAIDAGRTVLGLCLGAQLIAAARGAAVTRGTKEIGWFPVSAVPEVTPAAAQSPFGAVLPAAFEAFHWHGETFARPDGAVHLARSEACAQQAFAIGDRVLGLQCHLEMTPSGVEALAAACPGDLAPGRWVQPVPEMLADAGRFDRAHRTLHALLDTLAGAGEPR